MSATASSPAPPDPPPLLFASPRPASFTQMPPPPRRQTVDEPEDVDMTTSITLPAQNHDRQDAEMVDSNERSEREGVDNDAGREDWGGMVDEGVTAEDEASGSRVWATRVQAGNALATEMDTTLDSGAGPLETLDSQLSRPQSQTATGTSQSHPQSDRRAASSIDPPSLSIAESDLAPGNEGNPPTVGLPRVSDSPTHPSTPPPAPEAPVASGTRDNRDGTDSDSDMSDECEPRWRDIVEDTCEPSDDELEFIESKDQHSALDDEYWSTKVFPELHDPEHIPGEYGRIVWIVDRFCGTKENPNRDLLRESPKVSIGGYDWQIKLYPSGLQRDGIFSLFIKCATFCDEDTDRQLDFATSRKKGKGKSKVMASDGKRTSSADPPNAADLQHTPIPFIDPPCVVKRRSVAAQISFQVFNPDEPRTIDTDMMRSFLHRFCENEPDSGSRFFGKDVQVMAERVHGQRRALFQKDQIGIVARIRIVHDPTGALWERSSSRNPYDSLTMTGLQAITNSRVAGRNCGRLVAVVSIWMHMRPFRELLYKLQTPNLGKELHRRPKPMLLAFWRILYALRSRPERVGDNATTLDDLRTAFRWYLIKSDVLEAKSVVEIMEILRHKLELELADTPYANSLLELFGPRRRFEEPFKPTFTIPIGVGTQDAIRTSADNLVTAETASVFLTFEPQRWVYSSSTRRWKRLATRATIDEHIEVAGHRYTLFGMIVHFDEIHSGDYRSVVRPEGPGSKWYMYIDNGNETSKVRCITTKAALTANEGVTAGNTSNNDRAHLAHIVMYVRDDKAAFAFGTQGEPEWNVPPGLAEAVTKKREIAWRLSHACPTELTPRDGNTASQPPPTAKVRSESESSMLEQDDERSLDFTILVGFGESDAPNSTRMDLWDEKWADSPHIFNISLKPTLRVSEARDVIAKELPIVEEPAQVQFWCLDASSGDIRKPRSFSTGNWLVSGAPWRGDPRPHIDQTMAKIAEICPERRLFVTISAVELARKRMRQEAREALKAAETRPTDGDDAQMGRAQDESDASGPGPSLDTLIALHRQIRNEVWPTDDADQFIEAYTAGSPGPMHVSSGGGHPLLAAMDFMPETTADLPVKPWLAYHLRIFEPHTQDLAYHGVYHAPADADIHTEVSKHAPIPVEKLVIHEAGMSSGARLLLKDHTFQAYRIHTQTTLIAQRLISDDEIAQLENNLLFAEPRQLVMHEEKPTLLPWLAEGLVHTSFYGEGNYYGLVHLGKPHGEGKMIYLSGDSYVGTFFDGKRRGKGEMQFANGDVYAGDWVADQMHGHGTLVESSTGNVYEGGWRRGRKFGEGVTRWKKAQREGKSCSVCYEAEADAAFVECGHVACCLLCAQSCLAMGECPVCRVRVRARPVKLFLV